MIKLKQIFLFPVLLSWLIIFAHDVIPHHHHAAFACKHHNKSDIEYFQNADYSKESIFNVKTHSQCNYSIEEFQHFSLDQDFNLPLNQQVILLGAGDALIQYTLDYLNTKPVYLVQNHLRAPPQVSLFNL